MSCRLVALALAITGALASCNSAPDRPDKDAPPPPPASATSVAAAPPRGTASAVASAAPSGAAAGLAGTWEGRFEAKKGSVSLPAKVKDKGLAADDGKTAVGPGSLELFIGADGELRGKGRGALGACTLVGRAEEGTVRATLNPDDPRAANAMTGVLQGALEGDVIHGVINVSGPDATMVRMATVELKKK